MAILITFSTENFDKAYKHVLEEYKAFWAEKHCTPEVTFQDEPSDNLKKRKISAYFNRLANEVGLRTFTMYNSDCEIPLGGHSFKFASNALNPFLPDSITGDSGLVAHWNFCTDVDPYGTVSDATGNGHSGTIGSDASAEDGVLKMTSNTSDSMMGVSNHLDFQFTDQATYHFFMRPEDMITADYQYLLRKPATATDDGYGIVYRLEKDSKTTEDVRKLVVKGYYANPSSSFFLSGKGPLLTKNDGTKWHSITWVYDDRQGEYNSTLYIDGVPFSKPTNGNLFANSSDLEIGGFKGHLDEAFVMNKALDENEVAEIVKAGLGGC